MFTFGTIYCEIKMDNMRNEKVRQKHLDHPLEAGCSITGHKPYPLHVSRWDTGQTKKSNNTASWFLLFKVQFGFN